MSDMPSRTNPDDGDSMDAGLEQERPARRRRRGMRIALVTMASFVVLVGAVAAGGYAYVNHLAGSVHRIPVRFMKLDAAGQPLEVKGGGAMTVLITGKGIGPTGALGPPGPNISDLIMLLHINANHQAGGVVSIPPLAVVNVPGHGRTQINNALVYGGPSLLVQTVERLTHVQIDHYARIDFNHVASVVNTLGGVNVTLPEATTSFGHAFHVGVNHVGGVAALEYARQTSLTEEGRVLRQQSLMRAVIRRLVNHHLLTSPVTMYRVLHALIGMLTVDSDFTNSELEYLATEIGGLRGNRTFVTAPEHMVGGQFYLDRPISNKLWAAINQDAIAAFAQRYPFTVTPAAPQ